MVRWRGGDSAGSAAFRKPSDLSSTRHACPRRRETRSALAGLCHLRHVLRAPAAGAWNGWQGPGPSGTRPLALFVQRTLKATLENEGAARDRAPRPSRPEGRGRRAGPRPCPWEGSPREGETRVLGEPAAGPGRMSRLGPAWRRVQRGAGRRGRAAFLLTALLLQARLEVRPSLRSAGCAHGLACRAVLCLSSWQRWQSRRFNTASLRRTWGPVGDALCRSTGHSVSVMGGAGEHRGARELPAGPWVPGCAQCWLPAPVFLLRRSDLALSCLTGAQRGQHSPGRPLPGVTEEHRTEASSTAALRAGTGGSLTCVSL